MDKVIPVPGGGGNFPDSGLPLTTCTAAFTSYKHERRLKTFEDVREWWGVCKVKNCRTLSVSWRLSKTW
ncbi:MAG: hypothetical protein WCH99_16145, partial [Verrucomicrobiota bacterium]